MGELLWDQWGGGGGGDGDKINACKGERHAEEELHASFILRG